MIVSRQHFNLHGKCVIERLMIQPPFRLNAFFHNEACFLYMREGETILNASTERVSIGRKEGVLLKCGNYFADFISGAVSGLCEIYAVHLYPELLKEIFEKELPLLAKGGLAPTQRAKIKSEVIAEKFIDSLGMYFDNPQLFSDDLQKLKVKELIMLLMHTKDTESILELMSFLFTPRTATLREVINTHLFSNLTLEELSKLAGMSLSSFKRAFRKVFDEPPGTYIRNKRLERARVLLQHADLSIAEVAFQVGFDEAGHFSKLFTKRYQTTPSQYRSLGSPSRPL